MISGLPINPRLKDVGVIQRVTYTLNPYDKAEGPIRAMQKLMIILLTTVGTDPIRPWFGTKLSRICMMNTANNEETKLLISDEVSEGIRQFFKLQSEEFNQNNQTANDIIKSIELMDISIDANRRVSLKIKFTPLRYASIVYSLSV